MPFSPPAGTQLVEALGAGTVFDVAVVSEAGATLICKRLTPRAVRSPAGRAAIVREAKVLALARHPALPALVRVGTDAHGPFLLETRAEGVSFRELVDGWRFRGGRVPRLLVAHLARSAFEALAEIHELADEAGPLGIVHGDLGPDHLLIGPLGQVRLVDLGAARWRGMEPDLDTGDRGTLPFVAPEVARGETPPAAAGDVYALAATVLFLASGVPLVHAREQAAMLVEIGERGLRAELIGAAALGEPQRAALLAALALDPAARPASARALLAAFDA